MPAALYLAFSWNANSCSHPSPKAAKGGPPKFPQCGPPIQILRLLLGKPQSRSGFRLAAQTPPDRLNFTIAASDLGSRLAPPTSAPSISACDIRALVFSGLTLPP